MRLEFWSFIFRIVFIINYVSIFLNFFEYINYFIDKKKELLKFCYYWVMGDKECRLKGDWGFMFRGLKKKRDFN